MNKKIDPTYSTDLKIIYAKDIDAMAEMLRFSSDASLEKIYTDSKDKINTGKYQLSELIVHEAVKKLLNKY